MQLLVLVAAACIEDDGLRLFAHADELGLGKPMRLAMHRGRVGDAQVAAHVDRGIGGRRGCGAEGPRHGSDEWPHGDCDFHQDARDTKAGGLHAQETPGRTRPLTVPM